MYMTKGGAVSDISNELVAVEDVVEAEIVLDSDAQQMRDRYLSAEAQEDLARATPPNTERAYARWWDMATRWCAAVGRTAMPMSPETLTDFIAHLRRQTSERTGKPYSTSSLKQAVAAVRTAHNRAGLHNQPDTKDALGVIKVHAKDGAKAGARTRRAKPITLDVLRLLLAKCDTMTVRGRRDAALLVLGYGLMSRRSELADLRIEHLTPAEDWLSVFIPMSKTDQAAAGETVEIPRHLAPDIDALAIVTDYLAALAVRGVQAGHLLRRINRWGHVGEGLSAESISDITVALAKEAGITDAERVTAHGLRAGGPTDAAERGMPVPFIAEHGRWSKNSTQVLTYVRPADKRRNNPLLGGK
jgi:integrase